MAYYFPEKQQLRGEIMHKCDWQVKPATAVKTTAEEKSEQETLIEATILACKEFGAYEVRKAARRQMAGESDALTSVGLGGELTHHNLIKISNVALDHMTNDEILHEYCLDYNKDYSQYIKYSQLDK
jgi:hypothetical protein